MKKYSRLANFRKVSQSLLFFTLLMAGCGKQPAPAQATPTIQPTESIFINPSTDEWKEDLATLSETIKSVHPNPFKHLTESEFDQLVADLDDRLETLTDEQIMVEMMTTIAALQDGHTFITALQEAPGFQIYPLGLYLFEDGLYVVDAMEEYTEVIGQKVVSVGGMDTEMVLGLLWPTISHDNDSTIRMILPIRVILPEMLQALEIIDDTDHPEFVIESGSGEQTTLNPIPVSIESYREWITPETAPNIDTAYDELTFFSGLPEQPEPLYLQKRNSENFWYKYLIEDQILYIQYNFVLGSSPGSGSMRQIVTEMEATLEEEDVVQVVVDVRHNPGGDNTTYRPLLNFLTNYVGPLYVIIGRNTFSAAANFVTEMEQETEAVFIGEAMGGSPNLYGDARPFRLPNSNLIVMISTRYWEMSTADDIRNTIEPDEIILLSSDQFFNKIDPVMDFITGE